MIVTADELRAVLKYDETTGWFYWRIYRCGRALIGARAGCKNRTGYWRIWHDGHSYLAHRLAWLYVHGEWPRSHIDHINRRKRDNRIENLREVSQSINCRNRRRKTTGVTKMPSGKWQAQLCVPIEQVKRIGTYPTRKAARAAYIAARREFIRANPTLGHPRDDSGYQESMI